MEDTTAHWMSAVMAVGSVRSSAKARPCLESLACPTMSSLPTQVPSCGLILPGCSCLCPSTFVRVVFLSVDTEPDNCERFIYAGGRLWAERRACPSADHAVRSGLSVLMQR